MALDLADAALKQFPSSTKDGAAVPTSIGYCYGTYPHTLAATASALQTLPAAAESASFLSDVDCYIRFGDQVPSDTADTFVEDQLFIPAQVLVHAYLPSNTFKSLAAAVGRVEIQLWRPWKNMGVEALQSNI